MDAKTFYEQLAPELDPGGFKLYFTAQRLTGFELYKQFPYPHRIFTFHVLLLSNNAMLLTGCELLVTFTFSLV